MNMARWRSVLVILLATVFAPYGNALEQFQEAKETSPEQPAKTPEIRLEKYFQEDKSSVLIRTINDLPAPFRKILPTNWCSLDELAYQAGELILTGKGWRQKVYAILPCGIGAQPVSYQTLFVLRKESERAEIVLLPALSRLGGIEATRFPGYLAWHPENSPFTAEQGTDTIPHARFRHHYKSDPGNMDGLALIRLEKRIIGSPSIGNTEWEKVWEATQWGTIDLRHRSE